jgi:hypothetical protein
VHDAAVGDTGIGLHDGSNIAMQLPRGARPGDHLVVRQQAFAVDLDATPSR